MCRECIRTDDWSDYIELRRISDHFIFSVESVGCLAPERIVRDVSILVPRFKLPYFLYCSCCV
jgi:DNA-directed RNA polymerase alpha subunit